MSEDASAQPEQTKPEPKWEPLAAIDRRVLGVLIEKAKTTPDHYPMSLSAICTACNQKSNRSPVMNLEPDDVEESLDRLRHKGAVGLIEGYGRVSKYRHYLYEWLGVDKVEIAVMAELLLRGDQTEGNLRGRAARMEPIKDLADLRPVLNSLKAKGLVIPLTPDGRGHAVTHALYMPNELERIKSRYGTGEIPPPSPSASALPAATVPPAPVAAPEVIPVAPPPPAPPSVESNVVDDLRSEIEELRSQVSQLRSDIDDMSAELGKTQDELADLKNSLGG